ncbi:MAG: DUF2294 domain-containing protein [Pelosinus sp.]|nr:DUF2294 domain-containing protein [Pelosinus sp.]
MKKYIIKSSSYQETLHNLAEYHKVILRRVGSRFKFPNASVTPFIALRKNVEIGFLCSPLIEWEREAVAKYGKRPVFEEYYPLIFDFVKKVTIPQKADDYACKISYFYIFPPIYHKDMICSFFVNFFERPIFKNFNVQSNSLEQEIVAQISIFFRKQNKYGPEQISVAILDDEFITIMVSGLLTPFLKEFVRNETADAVVIEKIFVTQTEILLEQIFRKHFSTEIHKPFIFFDKINDKLIILSSLSQSIWDSFLDTIYI